MIKSKQESCLEKPKDERCPLTLDLKLFRSQIKEKHSTTENFNV